MKLVLLAALVSQTAPAHALCMASGIVPHVLTLASTIIPTDGGIVMGIMLGGAKLEPGDVAVQPTWRARVGNDAIAPRIESIAPGLAVYHIPAAEGSEARLEDDMHQPVVTVRLGHAGGAQLAAPKVKRLVYEVSHGRHGTTSVTAMLDAEAPEGAVALVLADASGVARSWGEGGGTSWRVLASGGCVVVPNGTRLSGVGDKVTLFWLGADGRVSASTKPMVIAPK